jgi:hypothetical protein
MTPVKITKPKAEVVGSKRTITQRKASEGIFLGVIDHRP